MTSPVLILFYFGLLLSRAAAVCTESMQKSCIKTLHPVTSFLRSLSTNLEKTDGVKIVDLDDWKEFKRKCEHSSGKDLVTEFETCYSGSLLGMFDVKIEANPASQTRDGPYVMSLPRVGDIDILRKFCCVLCDHCNAPSQETTTTVKTTSVTKQYGTTQEDTMQESNKTTVVIASISSFLGGALTTLSLLCLFNFVYKRRTKTKTDRNADEFQMIAVRKGNTHVESKKYESLTHTEGARDRPSSRTEGATYLTLDTNLELNQKSGEGTTWTNTNLTTAVDSQNQPQIYEQSVDAETDFHVYNTLKSEGTQDPYENANKQDIAECKYTELENRGDSKQTENQYALEPEIQHEESGEDNNYFLLEKEAEQTNNTRRETLNENDEKKNNAHEDDPSDMDHDYIKLELNGRPGDE